MNKTENKNQLTVKKRLLLGTITVVLILAVIEGTSWLGLLILEQKFDIRYHPQLHTQLSPRHQKALAKFIKNDFNLTGYSASLGWITKPNTNAAHGKYVINSKRIRAAREYSITPPADKVRIATFGDSYTFGMEVNNNDTFQEQLNMLDQNLEVLNFGIGGYGLDQAYLHYLDEGTEYSADIVLIGFMTENINRIVNVYRPYYSERTGLPLTKQRFILEENTLKLIKNPYEKLSDYQALLEHPESELPRLGKHDYYYHARYAKGPGDFLRTVRLVKMAVHDLFTVDIYDKQGIYNEHSEAYQLMLALFDSFHASVKKNGSQPVILIFPDFNDAVRFISNKPKKYQPLLDWLQAKKYPYIDLMDAITLFSETNKTADFFTKTHGHYSPHGNKFVAQQLREFLNK